MKALILVAVMCMGSAAIAQIIASPVPTCFSFNDPGAATPAGTIALACFQNDHGAAFIVHFVAPSAATVDFIEVWTPAGQNAGPTIEVFATASLGGPLSGSALATFVGEVQSAGWTPCGGVAPVVISAGSTYALRIRLRSSGPQMWWSCWAPCYVFSYDATGPTPLPYQYVPGACAPSIPTSGFLPVPLRFRGLACGPGPLAGLQPVGSIGACGGSGCQLAFTVPPVLGLPFPVSVMGSAGETAHLFWSAGVSSSPLSAISWFPCATFLNISSLSTLATMGLEPLASGVLSATPTGSGMLTWNFVVPASPAFAGMQLGVQTLVVGPSGTIPISPGVTGQFTSTYLLTLGY